MKLFVRKLFALALAFILISADRSVIAEKMEFPQDLTVIEKGAFYGASSIESVCLDEKVIEIHDLAFAYSGLKEITLPESLEYIADNAFEGCENLKVTVYEDSYAHKWAILGDVDYLVVSDAPQPEERFMLGGVKFIRKDEGASFTANITALEACVVRFSIFDDENGSCVADKSAGISAGYSGNFALSYEEDALPEYFIVEAVLQDEAGNQLCEPVQDIRNTRAYLQAEAGKPDEYPSDRVQNFGEAGFAVLAEGVTCVTGEVTVSGNNYSLSVSDLGGKMPEVGDILMLNVNGVARPVKVGSVVAGQSGMVSVRADKDIHLCDVYEKLSIDGKMKTDGSGGELGVGNVVNYKETFTYGDGVLTLDVDCGMSIDVKAQYDKINLGKDRFLFDMEAKVWGGGTGTLTGEYKTEDGDIELDIYSGKVIIPGINLPADLSVTLPVNIGVEGAGIVDVGFEKVIGFSWDSKNGFTKIDEPGNNWADASLEVNFHADMGPEVMMDVGIWEFFGVKVSAQVGVEATGNMFGKAHAGYEEPVDDEKIHACDSCMSLDVDLFAEANANIYYDISENLSGNLMDKEIFRIDGDLMDMYASIINEKESVFGGAYAEGFGLCPNYKYLVNVATENIDGKTVSGLPVLITGDNGSSESLVSPGKVHLYSASYTAEAEFDSGASDIKFTVSDTPKSVVVKEEEVTIGGVVTDEKTGEILRDVKVVLTLPDGKTRTDFTDAEGKYFFDKLPGGTYSFFFSKEGYTAINVNRINYLPGFNVQFDMALESDLLPVITAEAKAENIRVQALTAQGTCPEGVPEVFITVEEEDGYIGKVTVSHEDCAADYVYVPGWYIFAMEFFGIDMGDGKYTFVLQFANSGTGMSYEKIIFREEGGKINVLSNDMFNGISVNGSFSDNTHFSGVIQPTNVRITGEMPVPYSGFKRTGNSLTLMGGGGLTYELNSKGTYDLSHSLRYTSGGYNWDNIGCCITRYTIKDGQLTIIDQSFEMYEGGSVTIG